MLLRLIDAAAPGLASAVHLRRGTRGRMNRHKSQGKQHYQQHPVWSPDRNPETAQIVKPKGEKYMKRVTAILGTFGLVLALSLPSWAQVKQLPTHTVTLSGTVEAIDHAKRILSIKTDDGKFETLEVPQSAKRFDELKIGDKVSVTYNNNVSVRLKPPGEAAVDTGIATQTTGGERPGGTIAVVRTMTATIGAIDKSAPSITFVGPNGFKYTRRVVDPDVLDKVKVGDQVDITWNTDLTVSVE
jgi:hypothetical protein